MKFFIFFLLYLSTFIVTGQTVTVYDSKTQLPVESVAIYNKEKTRSTITDFSGNASLAQFTTQDEILFKNMGYNVVATTYQKIEQAGFKVYLMPKSEMMNEIVISASKFEQRKEDIPQKIIALNNEDVKINQPQTSADLLQQSGQVFIQKSQQGGGSPIIRGFSTNRLLLTIDGVRMNNAIFRGGNLQNVVSIDPLSIDRAEVILGPGSVVYGSDAIGGVMNFYTLEPRFNADSLQFSGNILGRYASANQEQTVHADFNLGTKRFAAVTSISLNYYDDLRQGAHGPDEYLRPVFVERENGNDVIKENDDELLQRPTAYDQLNLLQKLRYRASSKLDLTLGLLYTATGDVPRYDALTRFRESGQPRNAQWFYGPQTYFLTYFKAKLKGNGDWFNKAVITQSYQQFEESRNDRNFNSVQLFETDEQVDALTTSIDFERTNHLNTSLFYGVEYVHNKVNSTGQVTNVDTGVREAAASRYPDGSTWQSLAGYATYQLKPSEKVAVTAGARYNHIWLNAPFDSQFFNFPFDKATVDTGALTGALGITYKPASSWQLRSNLSTAFRAPNVDDIGKIFDPSPQTVVVPNPDIDSEYAYTIDAGINKTTPTYSFDIAGYYTLLDNALVIKDFTFNGQDSITFNGESSQVQAIQNADMTRIYGIELAARYNINKYWQLSGHYTRVQGKQDQDGEEVAVRHVSPDFGDVHVKYQRGKWFIDAFAQYSGSLSFNDLSPDQQDRPYLYVLDGNGDPFSPSWYTVNLRSNVNITDELTATATLENITDQRYRTYSSGVSAAGRNLILALNYAF